MNPSRLGHKVLVIASDPVLAALVGSLVETARLEVAFPAAAERPEDALIRVRPLAVILMDIMTNEAESDLFLARARKGGVQILMFGSAEAIARRGAWASARALPTFALPKDVDALHSALEAIRAPTPATARGGERRKAHTERNAKGTLIFDDGMGTRWSVYDRRASDRRSAVIDRRFVSDRGEVRHCAVSNEEAESLTVTGLSDQLARSVAE